MSNMHENLADEVWDLLAKEKHVAARDGSEYQHNIAELREFLARYIDKLNPTPGVWTTDNFPSGS